MIMIVWKSFCGLQKSEWSEWNHISLLDNSRRHCGTGATVWWQFWTVLANQSVLAPEFLVPVV